MSELNMARIEAVMEMRREILLAMHKVVKVHGENDPELDSIMATALTMVIQSLEYLNPHFVEFMINMLEKEVE